jgi:hypothetical protein
VIRLWAIAQQETCRSLNNNNNNKMTLREKRRSMGARLGFHAHAHSFFKRPQHARLPRLAWLILFFSLIYLFVMSSFNIRFLLNFFLFHHSIFDWFLFDLYNLFQFVSVCFIWDYLTLKKTSQHLIGVQFCECLFLLSYS